MGNEHAMMAENWRMSLKSGNSPVRQDVWRKYSAYRFLQKEEEKE